MPHARYHGPPMDLANIRAQGVRSLWVVCDLCHPRRRAERRRLRRCRAGASLGPPHGLHGLWHHRRIRPTELAGEANKRELNRSAVELIALELPC
jgi:hypothetical protein